VIQAAVERQGDHIGIERMCALAGVSRAGYYRHWLASKPRQEETALRDEIQRLSLVQRKNGYRDGYRPITVQLRRMGWTAFRWREPSSPKRGLGGEPQAGGADPPGRQPALRAEAVIPSADDGWAASLAGLA
jgi:hypothetical protein